MSQRLAMIEALLEKGSEDAFHWYARAMELRSLGRLDDALGAYEDVAKKFADYVPTYLMAAQVAVELDREDDARAWVERGLAIAAEKGDAHAASELRALLEDLE